MILKTVATEFYFAAEFEKIARKLVTEAGSPFNENDLKNFLAQSFGSKIEILFREFNDAYFSFPHYKRVGMYDKFDDYSENMLGKLINGLQMLIPTQDKNLKIIFSLTCNKMLSDIIQDLKLLGDEEFPKMIELEEIKILGWSK